MTSEQPKTCRRCADAAAWALGALDAQASARFQAHLSSCPVCAAEVAATTATVSALRAFPTHAPSADLTGRILRAIPDETARTAPIKRLVFTPMRFAMAASLAALLGLYLFSKIGAHNAETEAQRAMALDHHTRAAADWIAGQQEGDGTWQPSRTGGNDAYRPALTALSVLALQQQAPTHYAEAIQRGIGALVAMQTDEGGFCRTKGARLYNHAFASYALLALPETLARSPAVQTARERAIAFSLSMQNAQGGWDYDREGPGNTALSVWQIALLTQARAQGWQDSQGHLRRGLAWLQQQSNGREFGYRAPGVPASGQAGITLSAMATATLLDAARTYSALQPAADAAASLLRSLRAKQDITREDYYRDYFLARVSTRMDDRQTMEEISERLLTQCVTTGKGGARWRADDCWRTTGGDLYATTMAVLTQRL